jgi:hypothetical protein
MTGSNQVSNVVSSVVTPVALSGVKTPLLNQFEGAAAAYSLRRLKSWDDGSRVVRVRRESDNTERDFSSVEVSDGTMARWVNEQPTLPLDLRELDTNTGERDGALIEAAAAYSLRKLKEDFTGDVVEVRRNVDGETEGFTAAEVTDGTLEDFVNASFDDELPLDQATGAAAAYSLRSLGTNQWEYAGDTLEYESNFSAGVDDFIGLRGSTTSAVSSELVITSDATTGPHDANRSSSFVIGKTYTVEFEVKVPSTNTSTDGFRVLSGNEGISTGIITPTPDVWESHSASGVAGNARLYIQHADGGSVSFTGTSGDVIYIRNIKIYESLGDTEYLPSGKYVVQTRRSSDDAVKSFTASEVADGTLESWVAEEQAGWNVQPTMQIASGGGSITSQSSTSTSSTFTVSNTGGDAFLRVSGKPNSILAGAGDSVVVNISISGLANETKLRLYTSASNTSRALQSIDNGDNQEFTLTPTGQVGYIGFTGFNTTTEATVTINSITVTGKTGYVKTWYDQSGSDNHAVQTDTAKQPKIVDAGNLVTGGIDFDGSGQQLDLSGSGLDIFKDVGYGQAFSVVTSDETGLATSNIFGASTGSGVNRFLISNSNVNAGSYRIGGRRLDSDSFDSTSSSVAHGNNERLVTGFANWSDAEAYLYQDGVNVGTDLSFQTAGNTSNTSSTFAGLGLGLFDGRIREVIVYNTDQSTKRRAIEENIANHYDISLAAFSRDGTVSTWYDQSGSTPANDATQTDPTKQPKIVEGGTLQKDSRNNPAIVFDDENDNMDLTSDLATGGAYSAIAYHEFNAPSMILKGNLNFPRIRLTSSTNYNIGSYSPTVNQDFTVASTLGLVSVLKDASHNARVYANGTESSSGQQNVGSGSSPFQMLGTEVNDGAANGKLVEVIYYESDQSDNRTAIEANIGETYGITGIPAANDTVNGYVQTWYDQSGKCTSK